MLHFGCSTLKISCYPIKRTHFTVIKRLKSLVKSGLIEVTAFHPVDYFGGKVMDYEVIKLNVSKDKIREYKQFEGLKLYSTIIKSQDERTLTNKRIYVTKKNNYVYYERTDTNWNFWSNPKNHQSSFIPVEENHHILFEVASDLSAFSKYLGEELIQKIQIKQQNGEIIEKLDI